MKESTSSDLGICTLRAAFGLIVGLAGVGLAMLSLAATNLSYSADLSAESQAAVTIAQENSASLRDNPLAHPINTAPLDPTSAGWSIIGAPKAAGPQQLQAITCLSDSDCWAVGYYLNYFDHYSTLIAHWDGSSWSIVSSPNPAGTLGDHYLYGVTCISASQCWAVGTVNGQTLIEKWDGSSWVTITSPNQGTRANRLYGIFCTSLSNCWAVGTYNSTSTITQTLTEHWDGVSWTIVSSPNQGTRSNRLNSVACTSDTQCWAVGNYFSTSTQRSTLIEQWNGTSWSIVNSPNGGTATNNLQGVTCTTASQCWAVGYFGSGGPGQPLVERWDGFSWLIVNSPTHGTDDTLLAAVSCISASQCWAVGQYFIAATQVNQTFIEQWNGTAWTVVNSPNRGIGTNKFLGVACGSASRCQAVGFSSRTDQPSGSISPDQNLIEQWDGVCWSIVPSSNQPTAPGYLYGVTCTSASNCWAVGRWQVFYQGSSPFFTLIEQWNGTAWTVVPSPNPGGNDDVLYGVTCSSPSNCWAVGYSDVGPKTLTEQWNGTAWIAVTSPNQGTQGSFLYGVTCTAESNCWAVGAYFTTLGGNTVNQTLTERWDGNSWTIVPSPNQGSNDNRLYSIACTSASQCWAVGFAGSQTLIEKWDGNSWTIVSSPSPGNLSSVTCASQSQCWAIGQYNDVNGHTNTLIERWDGNSWTVVTSPNPSTTYNYLYAVACASTTECWAVGQYHDDSVFIGKTLIERWNGTSWTVFSSPNRVNGFNDYNDLYGVTCLPDAQCWSVGYANSSTDSTFDVTLIEQYSLTVPSLSGVVSRMTHGGAGAFDVNLPLISPAGIECRNRGGNYSVVFTFVNDVTNCGSVGTSGGSVINGPNANQCTENLTGVPNAQYTMVALNNILDSQNNSGNISVPMGVLIGDGNASGAVNSADVAQAKSRIGQPINSTNFRSDINASGTINATDVASIKAKIGTGLP